LFITVCSAWITGNLVKPQNVHRPSPQPFPISVLIVLIDWNAFLCINLSGELHAAAAAAGAAAAYSA